MKKLFALLMCCVLLMSLTAAFAETLSTAVFTLHGYEVGKDVDDAYVTENCDWLDIVASEAPIPGIEGLSWIIVDMTNPNHAEIATGTFQADKKYALFIIVSPTFITPEPTVVADDEEFDAVDLFELSNGYQDKTLIQMSVDQFLVGFLLNPPAAIPATGDGANLALWTAMLAFAVVGMVSLSRKAKFSR